MAEWLNRLDIKEEWKQAKEGEITTMQLAKAISTKLLEIINHHNSLTQDINELENIQEEFEFASKCEDFDDNEFDYLFEQLYDWGDCNHNCWIATIL